MTKRATVVRGTRAISANSAYSSNTIAAFDAVATLQARNPLEAARAATEQGYNDGLEAARRDVEAATEESSRRVRRAVAALSEAAADFERREAAALSETQDEIVRAALVIARAVLQRELELATDPGAEAIARALSLAPDRNAAVARLNPDDAATLNMTNVATGGRDIQVVADPAVEPGGCILDTPRTSIDAQLSTALANIAAAMELNQLDQ